MYTTDIGTATLTVSAFAWVDRRTQYRYVIATPDWRYEGGDLASGKDQKADEEQAMRDLASFLAACAEGRDYDRRTGGESDNASLFPDHVGEWAEQNLDDLMALSVDPD